MTTLTKGNEQVHFYKNEEGRCFVNNDGHFWHWTETTKEEWNRWLRDYIKNGWKRL